MKLIFTVVFSQFFQATFPCWLPIYWLVYFIYLPKVIWAELLGLLWFIASYLHQHRLFVGSDQHTRHLGKLLKNMYFTFSRLVLCILFTQFSMKLVSPETNKGKTVIISMIFNFFPIFFSETTAPSILWFSSLYSSFK